MIKFEFQYEKKEMVTVNNISNLFKKEVWRMFEEAVTQHVKPMLIHDLDSIRDELEQEETKIVCNFDKEKGQFNFSYEVSPELAEKLDKLLGRK